MRCACWDAGVPASQAIVSPTRRAFTKRRMRTSHGVPDAESCEKTPEVTMPRECESAASLRLSSARSAGRPCEARTPLSSATTCDSIPSLATEARTVRVAADASTALATSADAASSAASTTMRTNGTRPSARHAGTSFPSFGRLRG